MYMKRFSPGHRGNLIPKTAESFLGLSQFTIRLADCTSKLGALSRKLLFRVLSRALSRCILQGNRSARPIQIFSL